MEKIIQKIKNDLVGKNGFSGLIVLLPFFLLIENFLRTNFYSGNKYGKIVMILLSNMLGLVHELGHFSTTGIYIVGHLIYKNPVFWNDIITFNGTLFQILFPIVLGYKLYKSKEYIGVSISICLLGISFHSIGNYMVSARSSGVFSDAGALSKFYSSVGGKGEHDWWYMFYRTGMLENDVYIGHIFRMISTLIFLFGIWFGLYIIYLTYKVNKKICIDAVTADKKV